MVVRVIGGAIYADAGIQEEIPFIGIVKCPV